MSLIARYVFRQNAVALRGLPSPVPSPFLFCCLAKDRFHQTAKDDEPAQYAISDNTQALESVSGFCVHSKASYGADGKVEQQGPGPDIGVQDYLNDWAAVESLIARVRAASEALQKTHLGHVSDVELLCEAPTDGCVDVICKGACAAEGEVLRGAEGEAPEGGGARPGSRTAPTEGQLEEHLIRKLWDSGFRLIDRNWYVKPGLDNEGRGDLVFECPGGVHLVVEAKYVNRKVSGNSARVIRRRKRRKVVEQAVGYAAEWHSRVMGADRGVIAAVNTNEHGLVQLAWLVGRAGLGTKLCRLSCREGVALNRSDVDCVLDSLRDAGYAVADI